MTVSEKALAQARWTLCMQERPRVELRLFCFPWAGVGAPAFRGWAELLPPSVEVHGIQLPGRGHRLQDPCFMRLLDAVPAVIAGLEGLLDKPFAFFGHSMGTLLAFEVSRELARRGQSLPVHLFASGRRAPHLPASREPIAHLERDRFIDQLGRRYGGIPRQVLVESELLDLLLPALRADMAMIEGYCFTEDVALACPITACSGEDDPEVSHAELREWSRHTTRRFEARLYPGSHFYLQSTPLALLADLSATLNAAVAELPDGEGR